MPIISMSFVFLDKNAYSFSAYFYGCNGIMFGDSWSNAFFVRSFGCALFYYQEKHMENAKLNINKTKYRYFMDNVKPEGTAIIYTIPVPKGEEKPTDEFFDRDYPDVKISYKKFIKMIDKTAKGLLAYGVKKDDIVTVCHTNTPEIFYMDYALSKIGAIPNYIYPNITADEMKYFIEELDSKFVFVLDEPDIKKNIKKSA